MSKILGKLVLMAAIVGAGAEFNSFLDDKVSTSRKKDEVSKETQDKLISAAEAKRKRKEEKLKNSLNHEKIIFC